MFKMNGNDDEFGIDWCLYGRVLPLFPPNVLRTKLNAHIFYTLKIATRGCSMMKVLCEPLVTAVEQKNGYATEHEWAVQLSQVVEFSVPLSEFAIGSFKNDLINRGKIIEGDGLFHIAANAVFDMMMATTDMSRKIYDADAMAHLDKLLSYCCDKFHLEMTDESSSENIIRMAAWPKCCEIVPQSLRTMRSDDNVLEVPIFDVDEVDDECEDDDNKTYRLLAIPFVYDKKEPLYSRKILFGYTQSKNVYRYVHKGLEKLKTGGGCYSWEFAFLEKKQIIDFGNIKTVICGESGNAVHSAKFIGILRVTNFANKRQIRPHKLIDENNYFVQQLQNCQFELNEQWNADVV